MVQISRTMIRFRRGLAFRILKTTEFYMLYKKIQSQTRFDVARTILMPTEAVSSTPASIVPLSRHWNIPAVRKSGQPIRGFHAMKYLETSRVIRIEHQINEACAQDCSTRISTGRERSLVMS